MQISYPKAVLVVKRVDVIITMVVQKARKVVANSQVIGIYLSTVQ